MANGNNNEYNGYRTRTRGNKDKAIHNDDNNEQEANQTKQLIE